MLELQDGTRMNSQVRVQGQPTQPKKKGDQCKLNGSGAVNLVGTTSTTSFTWLVTFGRRHHSPPYNIFCASPWGLHLNVTFSLGLLLSQNFGRSYFFQIKFVLKMWGQYLITLKKIFLTMYSTPQSNFIWPLLWRDLWSGVKFPIWFMPHLLIITHANQV